MPTTYSDNLRIALIGNGEQSGTWGTTTNTNLGTLLEQAITGVQTITMANAAYILTAFNGASDEARNAVLVIEGTNSAVQNIIAPAKEKTYIIANNTVGGYDIRIKTSSSTGVLIPNGGKSVVYCDGTEFYIVLSPQSSANLPNNVVIRDSSGNFAAGTITANLDGNLTGAAPTAPTAAPGTNTTQIATTAFVQAALQALHPVGSIYIAVVSTNPATLFGFGTWVAFGTGRTLVGINTSDTSFDTVEETGGSKDAIVVAHTHTGTTASSGAHTHTQMSGAYDTDTGNGGPKGTNSVAGLFTYSPQQNTSTNTASAGAHTHTITTDSTGTSGTNANLPPYIVVYMWKRTA